MTSHPCPCAGACDCHGGSGAHRPPCSMPGGCGSTTTAAAEQRSTELCVLGCVDRTRTDIWPRPPRPRADGLLTCRACADRILLTLNEVLELAVNLELVTASGSVPPSGDGGRKRIKDEPVAPVPTRVNVTALTDVRSRRGSWVPPAPQQPVILVDEQGQPLPVEQLEADVDRDDRYLRAQITLHGPTSSQARDAASQLSYSQTQLRAATSAKPNGPRSIDPRDNDPNSVVGFLDRWTDRVRVDRELTGAGPCSARYLGSVRIRTGPLGSWQDWPKTMVCGRATEYRRLVRIDAGARTTGVFAVCTAGHVTRPPEQGDQQLAQRGGHGHRPTRGARHGLTIFSAIGLLRTHNQWICAQPWITDYWRGLRDLRSDLGQAFGEPRPMPIGRCTTGTGEVDETGQEIPCGTPLFANPYSDTIECQRCGTTWDHRHWRFLGRQLGVLA